MQVNGKKCAPLGAARETNAKRLERRESQRLEALAGDLGFQPLSKPPAMRVVLITPLGSRERRAFETKNHPLCGWGQRVIPEPIHLSG